MLKRAAMFAAFAFCLAALAPAAPGPVRIAEETLTLPTYKVGPADPNPIFYTGEAYQGAQKRVYPYALLDNLMDTKTEQAWKALTLENEFVKLQVLPELGGRLFTALDKTNNYPFFYQQHVIKPALIGMLGAWISGGIEWCVFHHHRNTTFMPVDYTLAENADGSKTIWFGETERRHRMKWLIGLTLRPGSSLVEATVKFFNRTPQPNSILYWANTAVHVNDDYQVLFPPSVQVATFHSKNDFTSWPIGRGRYSGYDYTGIDQSWWKNSPVHNSFFAWQLKEDFMGGYDHGKQAGVVHVGDHNVVSGCKLWEWGTGPLGRMWDKILTDADGPYAELMVGAFSDNQPDYSWIKPGEVKTFTQYWYPVRELGGVKNATTDAAVNLDLKDGKALLAFNATSARTATATLKAGGKTLLEETIEIGPDKPFRKELAVPAGIKETDLRAALVASGKELVAYQPVQREAVKDLPKTVEKPPRPQEIKNQEELYLQGLRVQQINSPTVNPMDYYLEGLKRDAGDTRCNIAAAVIENKRFMHAEAEKHLRKALERLTADYTRPVSGEAWYQLGLALRGQAKDAEAVDAFNRAAWDYAYRAASMTQLAELSSRKGDFVKALKEINTALETDALNTRAIGIRAALQRRTGWAETYPWAAREAIAQARAIDPLDFLAMNETARWDQAVLAQLKAKMRGDVQSYLELACDYIDCGLWDEALEVLQRPVQENIPFASTYPMLHYAMGYAWAQKGQTDKAAECYKQAAAAPLDYCFPFRAEERTFLDAALKQNPRDARALYYLGNLLYDNQPERALECWERAAAIDPQLAPVQRNLGWAYGRVKNDIPKAIDCYEKAAALNSKDPRLLVELDTLYEQGNIAPERRLAALEKNLETTRGRNESFLRELTVRTLVGQYDEVIAQLEKTKFHVREGGDETHEIHADAHLLRGLKELKAGRAEAALRDFQAAGEYPENLAVGKPKSDPRAAQVAYYTGLAYEAMGDQARARAAFQSAVGGLEPNAKRPDRNTEARYYQAACLEKLGRKDEAKRIFDELVRGAKRRLGGEGDEEYFVIFGERQGRAARQAAAHYTLGLGLLGQGDAPGARAEFDKAVKLNVSHLWARQRLSEL